MTITRPWNLTTDGREMLLVDDGDDDKLLIFCTDENLERYDSSTFNDKL